MPESPLYSVIVIHYNQTEYINTALDSVFSQNYPNIELIVADDGSKDYNEKKVLTYINKHKRDNIVSVKMLTNTENIGTVKTLNHALNECTGHYVQIFAADDCLADSKVFSNFVKASNEFGDNAKMISANAKMYDEFLKKCDSLFRPPTVHNQYGVLDAEAQFDIATCECIFAMGASCLRLDLLREYNFFDERYKYVEDWPFFIRILRDGIKVHTVPFVALHHRGGGISQSSVENSPFAVAYQKDIITTYVTEVIPYLSRFSIKRQQEVYGKYLFELQMRELRGGKDAFLPWRILWKNNKKFLIRRALLYYKSQIIKLIKDIGKIEIVICIFMMPCIILNFLRGSKYNDEFFQQVLIIANTMTSILFIIFLACTIGILGLLVSWLLFKAQRLEKWARVRRDEKR